MLCPNVQQILSLFPDEIRSLAATLRFIMAVNDINQHVAFSFCLISSTCIMAKIRVTGLPNCVSRLSCWRYGPLRLDKIRVRYVSGYDVLPSGAEASPGVN